MLVPEIVVIFTSAILGALVHETGHYLLGWIFGGNPSIGEYHFGIPSRVDFDTPMNMENWQVKLMGGWPYIFFPLLIIGAWFHIKWLVIFGAAGGLSISATDLNAVRHPEVWKKLTAGEPVHPANYQ